MVCCVIAPRKSGRTGPSSRCSSAAGARLAFANTDRMILLIRSSFDPIKARSFGQFNLED
jgi:hypothetical protein